MFHKKWTSKFSQRESDTQYVLRMDLRVGGVWVKGYWALLKSPRATVSEMVGVCTSLLFLFLRERNRNIWRKYHFYKLQFYFVFEPVIRADIWDSVAQTEQFWTNIMSCFLHSSAAVYPPTPPSFFTCVSKGVQLQWQCQSGGLPGTRPIRHPPPTASGHPRTVSPG